MAIKEQKLFFTRNGEYTFWEQLVNLTEEHLEILLNFCFTNFKPTGAPGEIDEYPYWLYKQFQSLTERKDKDLLNLKVIELFSETREPLNDFNALLYYVPAEMYDMTSAIANLASLNNIDFEIENIVIETFKREKGNQIDIRFRSPLISRYKESELEQFINTELRVYLDSKIILITNWSQYTHSEKQKEIFVNEVSKRVSSMRIDLNPFKFSDSLMRKLLHTGRQQTSKLKFALEDRLKVAIEIGQSFTIHEAILHDEIKYFYNKGSLALLKVTLDNDSSKSLIIDVEGKLMSRTKNLCCSDIDEFIERLHPLLKYDYLNEDYKGLFKNLAYVNLQGINYQKDIQVNKCLATLQKIISDKCKDPTSVFPTVILNTFLYCVVHQIYLTDQDSVQVEITESILRYIAQIRMVRREQINNILNTLLKHYYLLNHDIELLLEKYHELVNEYQRMINNATGT
ncbi:hypothetical protein KQI74_13815 [Paenibacillus barcinonensis]|uniref:hypothetical protein n=1 Tax=Paenibacillus barcinonensis TaxID=198119 RepID=UPI001C123795|nr:hypothetical protein [Paenibacillus barcinonensis]MBU5353368.1 hypothetical protein [Paenibacillus barcinonensis]